MSFQYICERVRGKKKNPVQIPSQPLYDFYPLPRGVAADWAASTCGALGGWCASNGSLLLAAEATFLAWRTATLIILRRPAPSRSTPHLSPACHAHFFAFLSRHVTRVILHPGRACASRPHHHHPNPLHGGVARSEIYRPAGCRRGEPRLHTDSSAPSPGECPGHARRSWHRLRLCECGRGASTCRGWWWVAFRRTRLAFLLSLPSFSLTHTRARICCHTARGARSAEPGLVFVVVFVCFFSKSMEVFFCGQNTGQRGPECSVMCDLHHWSIVPGYSVPC